MGEISEWLLEALSYAERRGKDVIGFRVVIQTVPDKTDEVAAELRRMGIRVIGTVSDFIIVADVKEPAQLDQIAKIPGVEYVSYEKKFWPMAYGLDELFKRIAIITDPLLSKLSQPDLERLGFRFKPTTEIPNPIKAAIENVQTIAKIADNPINAVKYIKWNFPFGPPVLCRVDWRLVTYTRELMDAPRDNLVSSIRVGVIDSELVPHPAFRKSYEYILLNEPGLLSHGQWVTTCAFGDPCPTRYGDFYPVSRITSGNLTFVKVFGTFGSCSSYQVMKAMEICAKKGCKVVNMSLGGTLTEPVDKDPECVLLDKLTQQYGTIFCVAAGNEDGEFEIGSPGAALKALTVAAMDWKTMQTSSYSSRGWQGKYYKKHPDVFEEHYAKYGDEFLKPDVAGIGGDRNSQIVAGATPWYDGMYDFVPDGFECMIGTSMATPHVAGIVALLVDRGAAKTVDDVKNVMRAISKQKNPETGWGLLKYSYF